jgi:ribosome assembly protein YihI (activator of Der GTPase)
MGGSNRQADRSRTGQRKKARKSAAKTVKKAVYKKTYTKQQLIDAKALLAKKMDAQSSSKQLRSDQSSGKSTQYLKKLAKAVIAELGSKIPVTTYADVQLHQEHKHREKKILLPKPECPGSRCGRKLLERVDRCLTSPGCASLSFRDTHKGLGLGQAQRG